MLTDHEHRHICGLRSVHRSLDSSAIIRARIRTRHIGDAGD